MPGLRLADVVMVDELGVVGGTLVPSWGRRLGHFIGRVLGDVVDNPRFGGEILDTLHAYLVSGGSPTEAARLLHLSPSSMKYGCGSSSRRSAIGWTTTTRRSRSSSRCAC